MLTNIYNSNMRILIIEDDLDTRDIIRLSLESEGYITEATADGERGIHLIQESKFDLIILDLSLPRKNGIDICKEIRAIGHHMPILVISVTTELPARVMMLDLGADDYLCKPFEYTELVARAKALLRRPQTMEQTVIIVDDLILNSSLSKVTRADRTIYLTKKEYNLLWYLMKNKGTVLSRGSILEHVWNAQNDPYSNTVEAHILNLRKKIERENEKELIHNIPGRGYKIDTMR